MGIGMKQKNVLPIGIENFEEMLKSGYYYVDKTMFIKELLDLKGEVNLFTRPRRFGKTLNLSMLRYFFEDTGDAGKNVRNKELFRNLKIMDAGEKYTGQMGMYPVINLTLKSAKQPGRRRLFCLMNMMFRWKMLISEDSMTRWQILSALCLNQL